MSSSAVSHHVFVDFENVPELELGLIEGKPVRVTLLIGKNQGKLDFGLVEQIHRLATQVELVKLDVAGRNALDLTLAYYLGQSVLRHEDCQFYIVSKDKDFDPLLTHLKDKGHKAHRSESFAALPFFPKPRKASPVRAAATAKPVAQVKPVVQSKPGDGDERFANLVERLRDNLAPRPKKKSGLLAHIKTAFGGKISDPESLQKLEELLRLKILFIDAKERVTYAAAK